MYRLPSRVRLWNFGEEVSRKCKGICGAPIFFILKYVLNNLLEEGFTIKEISTLLVVSESPIYRRMSQYGLSYSLGQDKEKELRVEVEKVAKNFLFVGKT